MQSRTLLRLLMIGALGMGAPLGCGSGDTAILAMIGTPPVRATQVVVSAMLDNKSAMNMQPLMPTEDHFEVALPSSVSGHLVLTAQALDADSCTDAASTGAIDLPAGRVDLAMPLVTQSPRKCGSLAPCAANTLCFSPKVQVATIQSVWSVSPTDIWAVGLTATILHFDGNVWKPVPAPAGVTENLFGVWAGASNNVWAVGAAGRIIHYDGTAWSIVFSPTLLTLYGIWGVSATNIWAVGASATVNVQGAFLQYNGVSWQGIFDTGLGVGSFNSVWADSTSFIYACGVNGLLTYYDGFFWNKMPSGTLANLHSIWGTRGGLSSSTLFATGDSGLILRYRAGMDVSWLPLPSTGTLNTLYGIHGDNSKTIYAVGSGGAVVRADAPYDSFVAQSNSALSTLFGVHLGGNGLAWVGGSSGLLGYLDSRP